MKSDKKLNSEILRITMTIQEKYPELSKYLGEMPVTIPDTKSPEINSDDLRAYYDSLNSLLKSYIHEHLPEGSQNKIKS